MAQAAIDVRSLARTYTPLAVRRLAEVARDSENDSAVVSACVALLDRGWGKAPQAITGENGEGGIEVIVRHIIEGERERAKIIEHQSQEK